MSPVGNRRNLARTGIVVGVISIGVSIGVLFGGSGSEVPPPLPNENRVDLLASRDYEADGSKPGGGTGDNAPSAADQTYTRSGDEICYPTAATAAACFAANELPYTVDATGTAWVVEPPATSMVVYTDNTMNCTNWSCVSATATTGQTDPAGGSSASLLSIGLAGRVDHVANFTDGATLYPRFWVKCSTGTLRLRNSSLGNGNWDVDCSAVAGSWTLIKSGHAALTEYVAWSGRVGASDSVRFYGLTAVDAHVWLPTITEVEGTGDAVIRAGATNGTIGTNLWSIDNSGGNYYQVGDTVTETITEMAGDCFQISGNDLLLTGAVGSECAGKWYALQIGE